MREQTLGCEYEGSRELHALGIVFREGAAVWSDSYVYLSIVFKKLLCKSNGRIHGPSEDIGVECKQHKSESLSMLQSLWVLRGVKS